MTTANKTHHPQAAPVQTPCRHGTLLIPDIHQDYGFLSRILENEPVMEFERVILLGDYFDSRDPDFRGPMAARKTARLIRRLKTDLGHRLILLWGNHDVPYFLAHTSSRRSPAFRSEPEEPKNRLGVNPESPATAHAVNKEWDLAFWRTLHPFVLVEGRLVSHAGLHRSLYPSNLRSIDGALDELSRQWAEGLRNPHAGNRPNRLLEAGEARSGAIGSVGGLTWLDWDHEFVDDLEFGQVVAHSSSARVRTRGRSHCIDYGQCAYAVLEDELLVKPI
jgi:hypothetical protein